MALTAVFTVQGVVSVKELHVPLSLVRRFPREEVARQAEAFAAGPAAAILDHLPESVAVFNAARQIIYANEPFRELLPEGHKSGRDLLGQRLGEALACLGAGLTPDGCGTAELCRHCGAGITLSALEAGQAAADGECRLNQCEGRHLGSLDFRLHVWTVPQDGEMLHAAVLTDTRAEKRLALMERIFYHDTLNLVSGMSGKRILTAILVLALPGLLGACGPGNTLVSRHTPSDGEDAQLKTVEASLQQIREQIKALEHKQAQSESRIAELQKKLGLPVGHTEAPAPAVPQGSALGAGFSRPAAEAAAPAASGLTPPAKEPAPGPATVPPAWNPMLPAAAQPGPEPTAMDANPLTKLPGNTSIIGRIQDLIDRQEDFALAYADLDYFKSFNDRYGFSRGDEVLMTLVKPPAAAAASPEAMSSFHSWPGSRRWVWASVRPGRRSRPRPSMFRASAYVTAGSWDASSRTRPSATSRSNRPSRPGTRTFVTASAGDVTGSPPCPCG